MAKIKQGILGGFSGKVANVVGTSWKGRAVMKSQPLSVANPKTDAQVSQRNKFSYIAELASSILTLFLQQVENPISGDISGYNLFCKDNKSAFDALGKLQAANFVCGGGKLVNLESVSLTATAGNTQGTIEWTNSENLPVVRLADKVYAVMFDEDGKLVNYLTGSDVRSIEEQDFEPVEGFAGFVATKTYYCLYAVVSADGRDVSVKTVCKTVVAA